MKKILEKSGKIKKIFFSAVLQLKVLPIKITKSFNKKGELILGGDKNIIYKILTTIIPITTQANAISTIGFKLALIKLFTFSPIFIVKNANP